MKILGWLAVAVIAALCVAVAVLMWDAYRSCAEGGGVMVRTLTGVECLQR